MNSMVMRRLAIAGFALGAFFPAGASAANFAGAWAVAGIMGKSIVSTTAPVCVFRQVGNELAGSCKGPSGIGSAHGVVSGSLIAWQWNRIATSPVQVNGIVIYKGTLVPGGLRGTWTDSARPDVVGTFTARRVQ
jgi:hypothetical protein